MHAVRRKPAKHDAGVIGLAVGAVIDKYKMKKHFALDIADGHFTFHRRHEEIAAEARLDGEEMNSSPFSDGYNCATLKVR